MARERKTGRPVPCVRFRCGIDGRCRNMKADAGRRSGPPRLRFAGYMAKSVGYAVSPRAQRTKPVTLMVPPRFLAHSSVYWLMDWSGFLTKACSVRQFSL